MSECSHSWGAVPAFCSFLSVDCVRQLTPTLQCAMTNHGYALVFFDYPCDMNHESAENT